MDFYLRAFVVFALVSLFSVAGHTETSLHFSEWGAQTIPPMILKKINEYKDRGGELEPADQMHTTVARYDLNGDKRDDLCVSYASFVLFGPEGAKIVCYISREAGLFTEVVSVTALPQSVTLPGTKTKNYYDLQFGGFASDGVTAKKPLWKWDGKKYSVDSRK